MSYKDDFDSMTKYAPWTIGKVFIRVILPISVLIIAVSILGYVLGWFGEAAQVVKEEFGPRAMLEKYEWFKDASAQLDKKSADIQVYQQRLTSMENDYAEKKRADWDRIDKEQFNQWRTEIAGVIASYNGLAAEYNSQMAKFNWRFANKGMLPQGANKALPREYKPYQYE